MVERNTPVATIKKTGQGFCSDFMGKGEKERKDIPEKGKKKRTLNNQGSFYYQRKAIELFV